MHGRMNFIARRKRTIFFSKIITAVLLFKKKYVTLPLVMKEGCSVLNTCGLIWDAVLIIG